jgi:transcriptional regulator with XRE-family HTH domain
MGNLRADFGKRLLAIRKHRRLTQEQFAELVGISVDFLSLIERGINAPSFESVERFAERLGVSVASLFAFDQEVSDITIVRAKTPTGSKHKQRRTR